MPDQTFVITGRIHRADGSGVHGLLVDVHDRDLVFYEILGTVQTNRDGVFQLEYQPEGLAALFDAEPEIVLTIKDAGGVKLHTMDDGSVCRLGDVASFEIELSDDLLKDHLAKVRGLSPEGGSLPPRRNLETVGEAWNQLARSRGDQRTFNNNWAFCPGPPIMRFEDLAHVAVQVIQGHPEGVERFLDMTSVPTEAAGRYSRPP